MTAPAGAIVSLYVDLVAPVAVNDLIETQTGRRYAVLDVRLQARGKRLGRQHLRAIVLGRDQDIAPDIARGATLHTIRWYVRSRGKR